MHEVGELELSRWQSRDRNDVNHVDWLLHPGDRWRLRYHQGTPAWP